MTAGAFLAQHIGECITLVVLLIFSGFFSGSETALFNLTRGQLHRMRNSRGSAAIVVSLMSQPLRTLHTLLLSNLLVNVAYSSIAAVIVLDMPKLGLSTGLAVMISLVPLLVLILLGEVAPKMLAYLLQERWALAVAMIVAVLGKILASPLWVLDRLVVGPMTRILVPNRTENADITNNELSSVLDLSAKRGIIDHDANALLQEIFELTDLRVADVMVPRVDMVAYDINESPHGLLELFRKTRLRRIPVYEGNIDNVLGLIHAKRLLLQNQSALRDLIVPAVFVPEAGNLERLLLQLRVKRAQTAIVVDEYGGTAGLVTLQDVLEEIVGEIPEADRMDQPPAVEQIDPQTYMINANLAIHEWADAFTIDLSGSRISTVGGFVTSLLGRIPRRADQATYRNLRFTVESMRGSRIGRLKLELLENAS